MIKTRIAPTPSGFLHLGNLYSFVLTWLTARCAPDKNNNAGGSVHLRLDDIDVQRCRPAYVEDIFATLDWLGVDWDSGAQNVGDFYKNHSQQLFLDEYRKAVDYLLENKKAYFCACSRKELSRRPCPCPAASLDLDLENANVRLITEKGAEVIIRNYDNCENTTIRKLAESVENFIIQDKNKVPAYMLVSVIEDLRNEINLIVRGQDLYDTTTAQLFLAEQFSAESFKNTRLKNTCFKNTRFLHHSLLLNDDGLKLSKSAGATAVQDLRTTYSKADFFRYFSHNLFAVKQDNNKDSNISSKAKNPPAILIDNLADMRAYFSANYWDLVGFSSMRSRLDHTF